MSIRIWDTFRNYANAFNYTAAGAVSSMRLGNGRWENTAFNSRLQPTQIGLGGSATNTSLLKLNYGYGTTDNNGNVKSQTINTGSSTFTQTYLYDSLNRLTEAKEVSSGSQTWKQNFGYDRFGNRTSLNEYTGENLTNNQTPQINAANNRFTTASGFVYDLNGNVITDNQGRTFNYDGENKQTKVTDASSNIVGEYIYDGDGKRVKKVVPNGETTIFVYDANSNLVAEYSTIVEPQATAKISYLTNDHLGSPRITTDVVGQVISRRDFRPYGEEIPRTGYGADAVRKKFTGYERDSETDLDFAQARYQSSALGRFSSPDPIILNLKVSNPQGWNKYIYVLNNPLWLIDPTGLIWGRSGNKVQWFDNEDAMKGAGFDAFTPLDWTYMSENGEWVTLNPDGPGSCNAAYDCEQRWFKSGWTYSSDPATWDRGPGHGVQDASLEFYSLVFGAAGIIKEGIKTLGGLVLRQAVVEGAEVIANGVTRKAIETAAADKGTVVNVISKIAQSPQTGRSLYVWEEGTEIMANQAIKEGATYTAKIPKALVETLRSAGLVKSETTSMNGVQGTALLFHEKASEFIVPFFK